jgi:DNA-3-methyladenine glycosylase
MEMMRANRNGRPQRELTNGPAKLAQALVIDKTLNGANLCAADGVIWVEAGAAVTAGTPVAQIQTGPRIGLGQTPEPWLSMPWRFWIRDNAYVSVK